jgi:hypothetical protein
MSLCTGRHLMRRGPAARGFTLLETMLAIALTATIGIAALSLVRMQARLAAAARLQEASLVQVTETVRLLGEDLTLAVRRGQDRFTITEGGLRLSTLARLPGEAAGLRAVDWRRDAASGRLMRTSVPIAGGAESTRRVGGPWASAHFSAEDGVLWLRGSIADGQPWSLPLWSEGP